MSDSPIRTSDETAQFAAAFIKAQAEMPAAPKSVKGQVGNQTRFYADLGAVVEAAKPVLAKHELGYTQMPGRFASGCITVTTRLLHASGEWMEGDLDMPVGQSGAQAVGSGITYAKRYALTAMLGIISEDDDGQAATSKPARQAPRPAPKPDSNLASDAQIAKLAAAFREFGVTDREEKLAKLARIVKHAVKSSRDLTKDEASECIDTIERAIQIERDRSHAEVPQG